MNLFLIYVVTQLISTAYGVTVINSVKKVPEVRMRLKKSGYIKKNKGSLYEFSDTISSFFKGFIPFYYAYKAIQLVSSPDPIEHLVNEEIKNGNYITKEDEMLFEEEAEKASESLAINPKEYFYEEVKPYKARKLDLNQIYNDDETPLEYIERESKKDESLKITPFVGDQTIVKEVVKKEEPKVEEKKTITSADIAEVLLSLDPEAKKKLAGALMRSTDSKTLSLNKDVA